MKFKNTFFDYWMLIKLCFKQQWKTKKILIPLISIWILFNLALIIFFRIEVYQLNNQASGGINYFKVVIYINNFYLLFLSIYIFIRQYFSSSSKGLISLEKKFGYNNSCIFFSRFLTLVFILVGMNLLMALIGSFTIINKIGATNWLYNRNVKAYFVLLFTTTISALTALLILSFVKFVFAIILIILTNSLLVFFANTNSVSVWNSYEKEINTSLESLTNGLNFYKEVKASGLEDIFDISDYVQKSIDENKGFVGIRTKFSYDSNPLDMRELRFWKMGQVLNVDINKPTAVDNDKFLLNQINPNLFDFFQEFSEAVLDYKSSTLITETLFSETQNKKIIIPNLKPVIDHLESKTEFWNKYKNIFEFISKDIFLQYKYGDWWSSNSSNYQTQNDILDDIPYIEQVKSNELYQQAPEFCVFAQIFMYYWSEVVENQIVFINNNEENNTKVFLSEKQLKKYNTTSFLKYVFNFSNYWKVLNTNNDFTSSYMDNNFSTYLTLSNAINITTFADVFDKNFYENKNFYKTPFTKSLQIKNTKVRWKILLTIYSLIILWGIIILGGIVWKFKNSYNL